MSVHFNNQNSELTFTSWFANIYHAIKSCVTGLWITFRYVWGVKPATIEYPEVREVLPERSRSRLYNDAQNCISCTQCAMACPVDCIYIASKRKGKDAPEEKTASGHPKKLELTQFTIDTALCCYCGLCTTVCPTECLTHSHDYEYASFNIDQMKYDYLSPEMVKWRDHIVN